MVPISMVVDIVELALDQNISGTDIPVGADDGHAHTQLLLEKAVHLGEKILLQADIKGAHVGDPRRGKGDALIILGAADVARLERFILEQAGDRGRLDRNLVEPEDAGLFAEMKGEPALVDAVLRGLEGEGETLPCRDQGKAAAAVAGPGRGIAHHCCADRARGLRPGGEGDGVERVLLQGKAGLFPLDVPAGAGYSRDRYLGRERADEGLHGRQGHGGAGGLVLLHLPVIAEFALFKAAILDEFAAAAVPASRQPGAAQLGGGGVFLLQKRQPLLVEHAGVAQGEPPAPGERPEQSLAPPAVERVLVGDLDHGHRRLLDQRQAGIGIAMGEQLAGELFVERPEIAVKIADRLAVVGD